MEANKESKLDGKDESEVDAKGESGLETKDESGLETKDESGLETKDESELVAKGEDENKEAETGEDSTPADANGENNQGKHLVFGFYHKTALLVFCPLPFCIEHNPRFSNRVKFKKCLHFSYDRITIV